LYSYAPVGAVTTIVPVAKAQVGCVVVTAAATGADGCAAIVTLFDAAEMHPSALVTVKV
jgi:hypothetical protein